MNQYLGMIEELIIYDMSRLMVALINISDYLPIYFINMFGNRVCTSLKDFKRLQSQEISENA